MAMFVNETGRNEQSLQRIFHRCFLPSFGSFGEVVSEEKISKNWPIRNKNCLWWPCLLMDRDKMSILYRGPSIDTSYQVSVHLAEGFQRRRLKCEKLTDDGCKVMAKAHITFGKVSKTGCLMINNKRYSHGEPFLPSSNHTKLVPLLSIKIAETFIFYLQTFSLFLLDLSTITR